MFTERELNESIDKRIQNVREEIKRLVEEYNLFRQTPYVRPDLFEFYRNYLSKEIDINIERLKILVGGTND
jgi:hypothetical protein